jgi:hypothetical protein
MNNTDFILTYVQTCASGKLGVSDCGPVWQLSVIAALLLIAIVTLLVLRLRARFVSAEA